MNNLRILEKNLENIAFEKTCRGMNNRIMEREIDGNIGLLSNFSKKLNRHNVIIEFVDKTKKYLAFLEKIDSKIRKHQKFNSEIQSSLDKMTMNLLQDIYRVEHVMSFLERKKIRQLFRKSIGKYIFQSELLKRFYKKPRGYPGDYFMFEMIYNNIPISHHVGYYFDQFILNYPLAQSVNNRKDFMKNVLLDMIASNDSKPCFVANMGCGSCREVREILSKMNINSKVKFLLFDQDWEGLEFAKKKISSQSNFANHCEFVNMNTIHMLGIGNKELEVTRKCDLIYTLGLVDYFRDNILEKFVKFCYSLLRKRGKLIIAVCSSRNPKTYTFLTWFCEWNFYIRSAIKTQRLIQESLKTDKIKISWEKNEQIFFVTVVKK